MRIRHLLVVGSLIPQWGFALCNINTFSKFVQHLKNSHPQLKYLEQSKRGSNLLVDIAQQRVNPSIEAETLFGDSLSGKVSSSSMTVLHTIERGEKLERRVQKARLVGARNKQQLLLQQQQIVSEEILKLHRMQQLDYQLELLEEAIASYKLIIKRLSKRPSLAPEQEVELGALMLAAQTYQLELSSLQSEKHSLQNRFKAIFPKSCQINFANIRVRFERHSLQEFKHHSVLEQLSLQDLAIAKIDMALEQSQGVSNIEIGPVISVDKSRDGSDFSIGLALTFDMPFFHSNEAGIRLAKSKVQEISWQKQWVEQTEQEHLRSLRINFNSYLAQLKKLPTRSRLEQKHVHFEKLFKRGVISTAMFIEIHRQWIEFVTARNKYEGQLLKMQLEYLIATKTFEQYTQE